MSGSPGPRSGDDTCDLIDDALAQLAGRRGAWLGDDITAITLTASLIDQAERFLPHFVTCARLNGCTWKQIAQALATTPPRPAAVTTPDHQPPTTDGPTTTTRQIPRAPEDHDHLLVQRR